MRPFPTTGAAQARRSSRQQHRVPRVDWHRETGRLVSSPKLLKRSVWIRNRPTLGGIMISVCWRALTVLTVLVLGCSAGGSRALALTQEEAKAQCRESVGRPIVTSCMFSRGVGAGLGKKTSSEIEEARKACMPKAYAPVVACVEKMMNAAHGRANVPVALTEEKPIEATLPDEGAVVFVAPPRTIKDITAILDEEKPDPVKLAKLQGKADAQPPSGVTKRDLAWFYFLRAHGRDQLGRLKDAIADIEKGLEVAQVGVEPLLAGRLRQLAIRLYLTAGSPKKALSVNSSSNPNP